VVTQLSRHCERSTDMNTIATKDGTDIYYKDWGEGPVVTFSHGWPLSSDAWDGQMLFLAQNGFRAVAHDRRGHGRSSQASSGNDIRPASRTPTSASRPSPRPISPRTSRSSTSRPWFCTVRTTRSFPSMTRPGNRPGSSGTRGKSTTRARRTASPPPIRTSSTPTCWPSSGASHDRHPRRGLSVRARRGQRPAGPQTCD
jgi:hypothetical protein